MYCEKCGATIPLGVTACQHCSASLHASTREAPREKIKIPLYILLPVFTALIFLLAHWVRYAGYEDVVSDYFKAVERGEEEAVASLYSWDYIEARNEEQRNQNTRFNHFDADFFTYDSTLHYISGNDDYYRHYLGDEIERWEISDTSRDLYRLLEPRINLKVRVRFENSHNDAIVMLYLRRGSDGWYITDCDTRRADGFG